MRRLAAPGLPGSQTRQVCCYVTHAACINVARLREPSLAVTSAGNRYLDVRETGTLERVSDLYVPRIVDGLLDELLLSFPAISLVGLGQQGRPPRRSGAAARSCEWTGRRFASR